MSPEFARNMARTILLIVVASAIALTQPAYRLRQVSAIPAGMMGMGDLACGDSDNDSLPDLSFFYALDSGFTYLWQIWEYRAVNRNVLVQSETCVGHPYVEPGLHKGLFIPTDLGDGDGDGLTDMLGVNTRVFGDTGGQGGIDSIWQYLCIYESPAPYSYPDTLAWSYMYGRDYFSCRAWFPGDLDRDGRKEILFDDGEAWTRIFENSGDNRYELVYSTPTHYAGCDYAFGDFDQDSAREFAFAPNQSEYVYVYECSGDNQYVLVDSIWHRYANGHDICFGRDLDGDGRPEFFVVYMRVVSGAKNIYYVTMYEATGNDSYEGVLIDTIVGNDVSGARGSDCADVDLDGVEELLVSHQDGVVVYRTVGNNQFRRVWEWSQYPQAQECFVRCLDMNGNGYPDILISSNGHTWVYEMEAVQVVAPNSRVSLVPGDTCQIRWRIFTPPRCDSVSLFLRTDTATVNGFYRLDTIATGLAPTESSYAWVVPPGPVDSCRILAIAYGPGWQFDESDNAFAILPGGVAEARQVAPRSWSLSVSPNPARGAVYVRYNVPRPAQVRVSLIDPCGRVVKDIAQGETAPGWYVVRLGGTDDIAEGVYYVTMQESGRERRTWTKKLVIQR
jgi:hypothetical protein